ncbi:MAG TPA: L-seryl-tRNA(Sec) selenium transferase [Propionibacteriaceae bacterium]|nr:L-seryl-tRNA(Sec) selenium transferase [Propionibacteriaceae bacterium]
MTTNADSAAGTGPIPPASASVGGGGSPVDPRRLVPRTDLVLADPRLRAAARRLGPALVKRAVGEAQALARAGSIQPGAVADAAVSALPPLPSSIQPVINATGVVLHTNLGRASLSPAAIDGVASAAGYVDVEYDLGTGRRARRGSGALAALHDAVPVAESVLVVNNGAAALVLVTTALAAGREVIVSRGEMVEIGDGFRLHELIASTGAVVREVGTTNRTSAADYAAAIGPATGCILKVHPSNFRVEGFTSSADVAELAALGPPTVVDIGSGLLAPDPLLPDEPDADSALRAGASVVTCSGDKLLGGPQAGLLLGTASVVEILRRHPLARALRVDKLTLAALEATLRGPTTPTWQALRAGTDELRQRARRLADIVGADTDADVVPSDGAVGGGGAPGVRLPGWAVALPERYAGALRTGSPAIVGRVERGRCLLDLRCVPPDQDVTLAAAILVARLSQTDGAGSS